MSDINDLLRRIEAAAPDPSLLTDNEYVKLYAYLKTHRWRVSFRAMQQAARGDLAERARLDRDNARWAALRLTLEYNRLLREASAASGDASGGEGKPPTKP